ncbi:hypothetical protein ACX27_17810 [Nostoc piscinale CENA21]|uniref:Uncharacterized protein n=1 Tax=Nostoc piscinale CENA21 TaxID=224013 RepID=A0A0M4SSU8_9NOSO|nr:hypothetical protein ACX27_17810 [Nostoc piscinale CENA21]
MNWLMTLRIKIQAQTSTEDINTRERVKIESNKFRASTAVHQTKKLILAKVIDLTATYFHTKQTHITHHI